ncbi:MAG: DUF362 domain-containing protein [Candidatus Zipacnadales bacterium]
MYETTFPSTISVRRISGIQPRGLATYNSELRCAAVERAVAEVCEARVDPTFFAGTRVIVKPNVFMPHAPATTDPRVTGGVVAWLLEAGAREVIVAEESSISTHIGRGSTTAEAFAHTGYDRLVASFNTPRVRLTELRCEGTERTPIREGIVLRQIEYPKLLLRAERLVNVPILKYHLQTVLTNALKNSWSFAEPLLRAANHCWGLAGALIDTHYVRPPDLTVVDALQPLTNDHSYGDPLDWRLVMAGRDSLALDVLGAWMLGFDDPKELETIKLGASLGCGEADLERLQVEGMKMTDLPRAKRPRVATLPCEFPPLQIEWQCGKKVGPGCVAYVTAGLRTLAQKAPTDLGRCQIFVGEAPSEPEHLADKVIFVGACSLQGQVFRNVQRRLYLGRRADDLIVIPACPPMALRTEVMRLMELDWTPRGTLG